ncbi:CCT domain, partial [Dillenia turbinata]
MAAANPQPLRARPYQGHDIDDHHIRLPIHIEDEDAEFDVDGDADADEPMDDDVDDIRLNSSATISDHGLVYASRTSELTLSFEGEVYVFPAVTPEKVQAVLLLLGGREIPSGIPSINVPYDQNNRGANYAPKRSNLSRRIASLVRFREKRKERCFDKKIRYTVRKEVAQRMHRKNGQFASLKEGRSGGSSWDSPQSSLQGDDTPRAETVLRRCQHCGVSENSTPAMRRGPAGPRTLCNACGLMWANKGTLRDLSKGGRHLLLDHVELEILEALKGTPLDIKPSIMDGGNFSGNQVEQATSQDPSQAGKEILEDSSLKPSEEDLHESADLSDTLPLGVVHQTDNLDEQ